MKASFLSLALCLLTLGAASAQTAPATRPAPPATMAAPNTERSDMSDAAKSVGTPVTDRSGSDNQTMRSGQKMKAKKSKSTMPDGSGKMKTKM
jgi:hypothetical protein